MSVQDLKDRIALLGVQIINLLTDRYVLAWVKGIAVAFIQGSTTAFAAIHIDYGSTFSLDSQWNVMQTLKLATTSGIVSMIFYLKSSPWPSKGGDK